MRIYLTGRITIEDGELVLHESELPKRQGRVVFARLVLEGGPVHRDVLAETLWPDDLPSTWERTLATVLSRLRSALSRFEGVKISNVSGSYRLEFPEEPEIDVMVAAAECDAADRALAVGDGARAASSAAVAAAITRRPFIAGNAGPWVDAKRSELQALLVRALEAGAEATLGTSEAVALAGEAVELEPFRERACILSMRAHHALGNSADALRVYEQHRALLAEELGADPGPDLRALHLELLGSGLESRVEALTRQGLVGLPTTHTAFVGRADVLGEIDPLLRSERLITLTGAGGVGKTRLAVEAARRAVAAFPDGARFVDLATISDVASIVEYLALALGVKCATPEALAAILDGQKVLVVLDNCEQVLDAVATLTRTLLAATTGPVVLATSRSPLRVEGEHVRRVPSMRLPAEGEPAGSAESVLLFCDRAATVRPDFELTSASAPAIVSICRRLDGVPLAIELAAARISAMSATEIAERLDDRFALLRGPAAGMPRHRTLRTAIDWSYDLLRPKDAEVFRRVSVFEGAFTLEDAEAVCDGAVADEIAALVERSLLVAADGRYRMLETIKEYARERAQASQEWTTAVERHIDRFAAVARQLDWTKEQVVYLERAEQIRDDATAALDRAAASDRPRDEVALAGALSHYWFLRGLTVEGRTKLERTVERAEAAGVSDGLAVALLGLGLIDYVERHLDVALARMGRALDVTTDQGDDWTRALVLANIASTLQALHGSDAPLDDAHLAVQVGDEAGNDAAVGVAYLMLFYPSYVAGDFARVVELAELALERFTRCGYPSGAARATTVLATVGEPLRPDWRELLEAAVHMCRTIDDRVTEGLILFQLGAMLGATGDVAGGLGCLQDAVRLNRRIGAVGVALDCVEQMALFAAVHADARQALALLAAVAAQRTQRSIPRSYSESDETIEQAAKHARERLGASAGEAWREGAKLSLEQIYEVALSMSVSHDAAGAVPSAVR